MRLYPLLFVLMSVVPASMPAVKSEAGSIAVLPAITLPMELPTWPTNLQATQNGGYYRPIAPQPYQRKCGTVATDVCEVPVTIPPGATGEQVYEMAKQAGASGQKGQAISYLKKSAEMGYPVAEGALGTGYMNGQEVPRDGKLGVYWLEKAVAHGSRGAQVELGIVYEDGLGVPVNHAKGFAYLKEAAEQHQSLAEHRVGLDYEIARGVGHDRALAISWLRRAAADGAPVAGDTASALERAKVAQFGSVEAIDDYMNPPPPAQKASGCPGFPHYISGPLAMSVQYLYCTCHPGCPTTWDTQGPRCPPGPPHCTN